MPVITTNDLKNWVLRDTTDNVDNTNLAFAVNAANLAVVNHCGRSFDTDTNATARRFRPLNGVTVFPDDFHTNAGLIVRTDETGDGTFDTTWATDDFELHPIDGIQYGQAWPYTKIRAVETRRFPCARRTTVEVTARWGWADVPDDVKMGALIFGGRLFKRKDSPQGVAGFGEMGALRISHKQDPDVVILLGDYVRPTRRASVR